MSPFKKKSVSPSSARLKSYSVLLAVLNDAMKFFTVALLLFAVAVALAIPKWANEKLVALGVRDISLGGIKVVMAETVNASGNALQVSDALTRAEITLKGASSLLNDATKPADRPPIDKTDLANTLEAIKVAQRSLDQQATSLLSAGKEAGVYQAIPAAGWIFIGYYGEDGVLRRGSDRIQITDRLRMLDEKLQEIVLTYDAPVVSNGDDCTIVDISKVPQVDVNAPERERAIVRASFAPLRVLATKACTAIGKGKLLYARIDIPPNRIRLAQLSTIKR